MTMQDTTKRDGHIRHPEFLPENYEKAMEEEFDGMYTTTYANEQTGDQFDIMQIHDESFSKSIDTESGQREQCIVKTYEAYYVSGNENHVLTWAEEGIYFEIISTLDQNTMIKIANSLK